MFLSLYIYLPGSNHTRGLTCEINMTYRSLITTKRLRSMLAANSDFEGVVTLLDPNGDMVDRVDFMAWPADTVLARSTRDGTGQWRLCNEASQAVHNVDFDCKPLASRPLGESSGRFRRILTEGDFAELAKGGDAMGMEAVKVLVDRDAGGVVHLLSPQYWDMHFTFVWNLCF